MSTRWTMDDIKEKGLSIIDTQKANLSNSTPLTSKERHHFIIGIDTGVNTGFAVWDKKQKSFITVETLQLHQVLFRIRVLKDSGLPFLVRVEDARLRKWFGKSGREQLQGAGSVKRDAKIWEDFLSDMHVDFEMVPPKNNKTKLDASKFKQITGWKERTNEHGRDAAMLCYGF